MYVIMCKRKIKEWLTCGESKPIYKRQITVSIFVIFTNREIYYSIKLMCMFFLCVIFPRLEHL